MESQGCQAGANDADDDRVRSIPVQREVLVPADPLPADGLLDLRGWDLKGGFLHLLQPWCKDRLVCVEWTSGDVSLAKLDTMMTKATMVGKWRRRGDVKWSAREPGLPVTLLIVGDHARPQWFTTWGLKFCEKMTGVWVLESDVYTVVFVRPRHLATLHGGSLWGLLPTHPEWQPAHGRTPVPSATGDADGSVLNTSCQYQPPPGVPTELSSLIFTSTAHPSRLPPLS